LPFKPLKTGLVLATFIVVGLVLATTAVAGRLACTSFAGVTGDGLVGAATASAGVVGEVTRGMPGGVTAATETASGAAAFVSGAAGTVATAASLVGEPDCSGPCIFIDEPIPSEAVISSEEDCLAD
jgi:hypothetical protein